MKHILYIPSGKYVMFYGNYSEGMIWSAEEYATHKTTKTLNEIIESLCSRDYFNEDIYEQAEIDVGEVLDISHFEIVDV